MKSLTLEGTERKEKGAKDTARLRREKFIPCNLYGGKENVQFYAPYSAFQKIVYNPDFFTVKVNVSGKEYITLIKEVQLHPVTDKVMHIDFLELAPGKKVVAEIPIKLKGLAEGVKAGGRLFQKIRKLKVRAFAKDLIDHIEIDVTNIALGKSIKVSDLSLNNIEVITSSYIPICSVNIPRVVVEEAPVAAAAPVAEGAAEAGKEGAKEGAKEAGKEGAKEGAKEAAPAAKAEKKGK